MNFGYARISTSRGQDTAAQIDALRAAGCERMFEERASGGRWDRPELHRMLDQLRNGDVVIVWKLDRLSRSLKDLLSIMAKIDAAGAGFRSLTESIDTTTPAGRMMMQMVGVFAEFEREMIRERTRAGLERARKKGRHPGRKPKLSDDQRQEIRDLVRSGKRTEAEAARLVQCPSLHDQPCHARGQRPMQQLEMFPDDIRIERVDPDANMYRFYRLRLMPDLFGGVSLLREWGRIGTQGRHQDRAVLRMPAAQPMP